MTLNPVISDAVRVMVRGEFTDGALNALHADAFGGAVGATPWNARLARHSLTWVTAWADESLVAFVNVLGDGGQHAFLLDTVVDSRFQRHGLGTRVVDAAADEARRLGCRWLHADYEPHLVSFYEARCGLQATEAGLLRL